MKVLSLYACAAGIYAAVAQPLVISRAPSSQAANAMLDIFEQLQTNIHNEVGAIHSALDGVNQDASQEDKDVSLDAVKSSFERIISHVQDAADSPVPEAAASDGDDLQQRDVDFSPIVIRFFDILQKIAADLVPAFSKSLDKFQHSPIIGKLSGVFVKIILKFIDKFLKGALKLPFADQLREGINNIIKHIPI